MLGAFQALGRGGERGVGLRELLARPFDRRRAEHRRDVGPSSDPFLPLHKRPQALWGGDRAVAGASDDHERRRPSGPDRALHHFHRLACRARGGKLRGVRRAHVQRAGRGGQREHPREDHGDRDRGVGDQAFGQRARSAAAAL